MNGVSPNELFEFYQREGERGHHQKEIYSDVAHRKLMQTIMTLLNEYFLTGKKNCFDVGCAEGWYSRWISKKGHFVVGMDISLPKLKRAVKEDHGPKTSYVQGSWDFLPFQREIFDVALFIEGPEHSLSPKRAINEISRVIKKRGYLIISCPISAREQVGRKASLEEAGGHLHTFTSRSLGD